MKIKSILLLGILFFLSACKSNNGLSVTSIQGAWNILTACGVSTVSGENQAFISFEASGKMNGNASVNNFFGSYKYNGTKLELSNIGMTRMLGASMQVEKAVTAALNAVATIKVKGNEATVYDAQGKEIMTLQKK